MRQSVRREIERRDATACGERRSLSILNGDIGRFSEGVFAIVYKGTLYHAGMGIKQKAAPALRFIVGPSKTCKTAPTRSRLRSAASSFPGRRDARSRGSRRRPYGFQETRGRL